MFRDLTALSKAFLYYSIAFGLCTGVTLMAPYWGPRTADLAMFTPVAAVLVMFLVITRDGYVKDSWKALGIHRAGLSGWGLALTLPLVVLGIAYGAVWWSGIALFVVPEGVAAPVSFILEVVASIAIIALLGGIGEEIGWRGYLLPRLMPLGLRPALLLSGFLHGLWHLPVILWTPFYHGAGNRSIVVPLFLLTLTVAGVCYGYLRLTTNSVWPAAIAHSAFNIYWNRLNAFTVSGSPAATEYLAGESGLLTLTVLVIAAVVLIRRLPPRFAGKPQQGKECDGRC